MGNKLIGRRPSLTRADATREALHLIDAEGLSALTLAALARRLGVRVPSLYNHFVDRGDLLRLTARTMLAAAGELPMVEPVADWKSLLLDRAVQVRRAILAHPNAAPLLVDISPRFAPPAAYDYWVAVLGARSVPMERWLVILEGLEGITYGSAMSAAAQVRLGLADFPSVDSGSFPTLAKALAAEDRSSEQRFLAALSAFLRGIEAD